MGHGVGREQSRFMAEPRDHALVTVAESENPLHAIAARELEHDAPDDVVQPRAQATARDDAAADRTRIEEDLIARAG